MIHICLLNLGSAHWLGGRYYFENIIRALTETTETRKRIKLTYVIAKADESITHGEIGKLCNVVVAPHLIAPSQFLRDKGRRYLQRRLLGQKNPALHDFLLQLKVDFAFPCAIGGSSKKPYRTAHWIADLQFKHFPDFQLPNILKDQEAYLEDIAENASTIVVSSQFGAEDCARFFSKTRERLFVMPFRVTFADQLFADATINAVKKYHLPAQYVLVSNQFWQNKNHSIVFEAIANLKEKGVRANVVCTGHVYDPRLPEYSDIIHAKVHELGVGQEVIFLGAIPRTDQFDLLRRAAVVLQPSLFEGWNTSIEEARALGRPVIASDIPVHREQHWEGMRLYKSRDVGALADAIEGIWGDGNGGTIDLHHEQNALTEYAKSAADFASRFMTLAEGTANAISLDRQTAR